MDERRKQHFARYFSIFFSLVLIVCGLSLLSLGLFVESVRQDYEAISTFSALPSSVVIFLAVGVMGVGIVGLIGFKMQNVKVMRVFLYVSVVLIAVELCVGILSFVYAEVAAKNLAEELKFNTSAYGQPGNNRFTETIDKMQIEFECCGARSFLDWQRHTEYRCDIGYYHSMCEVPKSCCPIEDWRRCVFSPINATNGEYRGNLVSTGCAFAFRSWVESKVDTIGIASLVVIIPQVVCGLVLNWLVQYVDLKAVLYELKL